MFYSIVIPTFGRPDEVTLLIDSITKQQADNFELIIVDGSLDSILYPVIEKFRNLITILYIHEKGLGTSESRNHGCEKAKGDFFIFIDSDCIIPSDYLKKVDNFLQKNKVDAFGGPDAALDNFSVQQKAVNYAMTSLLTTGGIRGKKKHIGKFQIRGFNMGVSKEAFFKVGGYSSIQVAEDIDLSMKLTKAGFITALIHDAFVYHRRRTSLRLFYKQLFFHGKGRIDLQMIHGNALKLIHLLPSFFILFLLSGLVLIFFNQMLALGFAAIFFLYVLAIFLDSSFQNKSMIVGLLSVVASIEMHLAYGSGVIRNIFVRMILGRDNDSIKKSELKE